VFAPRPLRVRRLDAPSRSVCIYMEYRIAKGLMLV
jgi:hypothetical protein